MNKSPLVSIIMNCYNGEKYLHQALDSIVSQTYQNWELIFWDNQSTDDSKNIFDSYQDSRLKYYYAENHTMLYEARNYATNKASGEFLAFLDVDDTWELDKLEKQLPLFDNEMVGLVYGNYVVRDEMTSSQHLMFDKILPSGWVVDSLLDDYIVGLLTIIIRRKAFDSLEKQFDSRFHIIGDFDFALRISTHWKFDCIQESVANYRQHGNNESIKHRDKFIEESLTWYSEMRYHSEFSEKEEIYKKYNLFLYHDAILRKIEGNQIKTVFSILTMLPLGVLKLRLLIIIFLPKFLKNKLAYVK
jgi:glycosyltransferase involved in cell wall biosynthesis